MIPCRSLAMGSVRVGTCSRGRAAPAPAVSSVRHRAEDAARRSPVLSFLFSCPFPSSPRPQRRAVEFPWRRRRRPSHGVAVTVTGVVAASGPARCHPLSESSSAPRRRAAFNHAVPRTHPRKAARPSRGVINMRAYACARPATLPRSLSPRSLPRRPAGKAGTGPRVFNVRLLFNLRTCMCLPPATLPSSLSPRSLRERTR